MRPRGLSSSSPSKTYVGQVAVQNPQWVQVRNTFSEAAMPGSVSCSAVKSVRTRSTPFEDAPWVQNPAGVEALLDAGGERCERGGLRLEDRDSLAQRGRAFDQRGVTGAISVRAVDRRPDRYGAAVIGAGNRGPDKAASPIQVPSGIETIGKRLPELGAAAGCNRNAPDGSARQIGERQDIANPSPESDGSLIVQCRCFAIRGELLK